MTTTDLPRQAVALLRERATAAAQADTMGLDWAEALANWLGGPAGELCSVMSPSVALALADWLDVHARDLGLSGSISSTDSPADVHHAITVAQAILRETDDSRG